MRTACCIAAGAVLHTLLVFAPLLAIAGPLRVAAEPRCWVFLAAVNLFYAVELLAMKHAARRPMGALSSADRHLHRLSLASCAAIILIFWAAEAEAVWTAASPWSIAVGSVVLAAGVLLRGCAILQLRAQFVSEPSRPGQGALMQDGLYARMRHPSETGLMLIVAGVSLLLESRVAALLVAIVLLPLIFVRIRLEERGLRSAFGAEFDRYRARVPALTPCFRGCGCCGQVFFRGAAAAKLSRPACWQSLPPIPPSLDAYGRLPENAANLGARVALFWHKDLPDYSPTTKRSFS